MKHTQATISTPSEDDVKKEAVKVRIKMLGNFGKYTAGQVLEVPEEEAVTLLTLGYAVASAPEAQAKE